MHLLTNVIMIQMQQVLSPFQLPCSNYTNAHAYLIPYGSINEYTYENGVQFEIKSLQLLRLSSFIVSEDIILILVNQNFTMNVTGWS